MNWSESIPMNRPLHGVRLLTRAPAHDWEEQLREREQAAYEHGRRDGARMQHEEFSRRQDEISELLNGVLESLRQTVPRVVHETEGALINLALESAQKMVAGLPVSVEMIEAVVREAVRQTEDSAEITVLLHPDDLALLRQNKSPVLGGLPESGPLRFIGSAEATRGGCLVQTRFGLIDARRETKFEQLRQALAA
jgi:flagellar assembly protein FliH